MGKTSYFVIICVVILALVSLLLPEKFSQSVRQKSSDFLSPFWNSVGWTRDKFTIVQSSLKTIDLLEKEVKQLRAENTQLSAENSQMGSLKSENMRLKEMLDLKKSSPFRLLACKVVKRDPSDWWSAVEIDRGWEDDKDLAPDQPVITPRGIVGKTGEVSKKSTRVILLVDENCKISAEVEGSGARGIVMGAASSNMGSLYCRLTYVSREKEIPVGARVFSSGLGGNFPQGLLIGTVKEALALTSERNFGLFRDGVVDPMVDLNDLKELFVIVGVK